MVDYYYLHTNGDLIHKRFAPDTSDFVVKVWCCDITNRKTAWKLLLEATELGARRDRVERLAEHWKCDSRDLCEYMTRNITPTNLERQGLEKFLSEILKVDHNEWFDWFASTPKGQDLNFETMPVAAEQ